MGPLGGGGGGGPTSTSTPAFSWWGLPRNFFGGGGSRSLFQAVGPANGWQGWRWVPWGEGHSHFIFVFHFLGGGVYQEIALAEIGCTSSFLVKDASFLMWQEWDSSLLPLKFTRYKGLDKNKNNLKVTRKQGTSRFSWPRPSRTGFSRRQTHCW